MERSLLILYGSETGCAQDVAEGIWRQGRRRRFNVRVMAMDEYPKESLLEEKLIVFVCSTTGQGKEPANMTHFWRFLLRKNLPHNILNHLECAVFGLGDSSYQQFNYPAKKLYKRLQQLGATMVMTRGDGDDQHYMGLDGALVPWLRDFWAVIDEKYSLPPGQEPIPDDVRLPPTFTIEWLDDSSTQENGLEKHHDGPQEFNMVVVENKRITAPDHFQDVRHVILRDDSEKIRYDPGDVAVIYPQNIPAEVDAFLEQIGYEQYANKRIRIHGGKDRPVPSHWPSIMAFRDLFIYHLDVFGVPRRSFFEMLAYFTQDSDRTERLREFASPEGQEDMWAYCQRPRRTIAEVFFDFQPILVEPLDYILDLFPPIRPRSFSIASSLRAHPNEIQLCVAIVKYKTVLRKIRRGVFTRWLTTWQTGDIIPRIRVTKGTMKVPTNPDIPLVSIGPGNLLFFGCRHQEKDYHFKDEWEHYASKDQLEVFTAFSRDQENKIYVQDSIRSLADKVWDLVDKQKAKVVLSGSAGNMPKQIAYALKQVFMSQGGLDAAEAETYFQTMTKTGQYEEECWS